MTGNGGKIRLGINHNLSTIPQSSRLWADTQTNFEYISVEQHITKNSKLFFGNGTNPNIYLSANKGIGHRGIPFLEFSSDGSFMGMDISLPSGKSLIFSFLVSLFRQLFNVDYLIQY